MVQYEKRKESQRQGQPVQLPTRVTERQEQRGAMHPRYIPAVERRHIQSWPRAGGSFSFGWLDAARWWLLYPGRMEFLLWIAACLLLVVATGALLVALAWSLGWAS